MATKENDTARSGKMESLDQVLERIQRRTYLPKDTRMKPNLMMQEDWDWLVVLQCMQDHQLFKNPPKRPPLKAFEQWVNERELATHWCKCSADEMTIACRNIKGARYPWNEVMWELATLRRWRILYEAMSSLFADLQNQQSHTYV